MVHPTFKITLQWLRKLNAQSRARLDERVRRDHDDGGVNGDRTSIELPFAAMNVVNNVGDPHSHEAREYITNKRLFGYARKLRATNVPVVHERCCAKRCLDAIEARMPGWLAREKTSLDKLKFDPNEHGQLRALFAMPSRKHGGIPHSTAYSERVARIAAELDAMHTCKAALFFFCSRKWYYSNHSRLSNEEAANENHEAEKLMSQARCCCRQECIQKKMGSVATMAYWIAEAQKAQSQQNMLSLVRRFLVTYEGICTNAVVQVLKCAVRVVKHARSLNAGDAPAPVHGLVTYRQLVPPKNKNLDLELTVFEFLDTHAEGNPTTRKAHFSDLGQVRTFRGMYKEFKRLTQLQTAESTFQDIAHRWLDKHGYLGFDDRGVDHNVCVRCKEFKFRFDEIKIALREAQASMEDVSRDAAIEKLEKEKANLRHQLRQHQDSNRECRETIQFYVDQSKFHSYATGRTLEYGGPPDVTKLPISPPRCSNGGLHVFHLDGEAGRLVPKVNLATDGGGFFGERVKNVGAHDCATGTMANSFIPPALGHESTSIVFDIIMRQAMRCRGEEVFVVVMDRCAVNYNGCIWSIGPLLVDELKWFKAVVFVYYLARHGKGPADKNFGGHKSVYTRANVFCEDSLGQAYLDALGERESVTILEPTSVCDWKNWQYERSNGRSGHGINIQVEGWNEIVTVRADFCEANGAALCAAEVRERLTPFIAPIGYYKMRNGLNGEFHAYNTRPSARNPRFVPAKPRMLLPDVQILESEDGTTTVVGKYPLNRTNLRNNGYKNARLKQYARDIAAHPHRYGAPLIPVEYDANALKARGVNYIERPPALRDNLPSTGPVYPSLIELNIMQGRSLFDTTDVEFVSHVPNGKSFLVADVDERTACYTKFLEFSQRVQDAPGEIITTADVIEATSDGFSFHDREPVCTLKEYLKTRTRFPSDAAYRRPPKIEIMPLISNVIRRSIARATSATSLERDTIRDMNPVLARDASTSDDPL